MVTEFPIHWENGDNMTHLSIRTATEGSGKPKEVPTTTADVTTEPENMELADEDWKSVYIPILPSNMYVNNPVDNSYHTFQPRNLKSLLENELRFVLITSSSEVKSLSDAPSDLHELTLANGDTIKIAIQKSSNEKCVRCWHLRADVGEHKDHPELCLRCVDNVDGSGEVRKYA